ncbi:MAG: chloride channel protein, partial [Desulfuromonadaceae bacterium]|nr:chloride channel protein [Desulfuromonadaceae bacterium]
MPQRLQLRNTLNKLDIRSVGRFMLLSCLVGLVAGIGAVAFYMVTNFSEFWILGKWSGFHPPMAE